MRWATIAALAFLFSQAQGPAQQQRQIPAGSIEGLVLQAASSDPIPKAQVTLIRVVPPPANLTPATLPTPIASIPPILTDAVGKFSFANLEPGTYRVSAGRNGFVRMNYGERFSTGPGTIITVPAGQTLKDVNFRLVQTAVVSGRVRDASGDAAAGLGVQLMKSMYNVTGQRSFQTVASGRTDDRGEYRLFWISPGRYYLAVTANRNALTLISIDGIILSGGTSANEIASTGQATVFYPGTVDPLRASLIDVGAGGELAGVDFLLPQQPVYRVRGRVVDSATGQPPRSASINLIPRDTTITTLTLSANPNYNPVTGTFDLRDVAPGQYWLRAQASESTATATVPASAVGRTVSDVLTMTIGSRMAAQIPVDVTGDLEGLALNMSAGLSVPGILRVEGPPLPTTPTSPRVTLRASAPTGLSSALQPVNTDGTFTLMNVFPGEYRVMVTPMPPDYYIKEARNEQSDVLNQPWVIGNAIRGSLEVVLSSGAGQIEGTVIDAKSQPVGSLQAVLIPDQDRSRTELIKTSVTDQNGKFTFRGVAPGDYKIFAWEGIESNAFFDPEVLRQYEQQGKAVRVAEGAKLTAEVKMIPAK
jgi:Carboxypeptidase regulatory-like domain